MTDQQYPESEKLSVESSEWGAINDFLEFLSSKGIQLHVWTEDDYVELCTGSIMNGCDGGKYVDTFGTTTGHPCPICDGTGECTVHRSGWSAPNTSQQNLIYEHLSVDPVKLEAERRDMLSSLGF